MINPSASGWIDNIFLKQKNKDKLRMIISNLFYTTIKNRIYMVISLFETTVPIITKGWVQNEIPKVALLNTLYAIRLSLRKILIHSFTKALEFYNEMTPQGYNLLKKYYLIVRLL
jgi:hypothetical protein